MSGPFRTEAEHWAHVESLAQELHGELVDLGAIYGEGREAELAEAVANFVRSRPPRPQKTTQAGPSPAW